MRTGRAGGLPTADRLEPVRHSALGVITNFEVIAHGYEQTAHEDGDPAEIVAIHPAKLGIEAAVEGHLVYELT